MNRNLRTALACSLVVFGLTRAASAATITWGSPTLISGPHDVFGGLALVDSIMLSNSNLNSTTTVNGVVFDRAVLSAGLQTSAAGNITVKEAADQASMAPATGNAAYDNLLSWESYVAPGDIFTITLSGLHSGGQYVVQAWTDDFDHGINQNGLNLDYGKPNAAFAQSGNYIIGKFTADATTQTFTWGSGGSLYNTMDALQVQLVPEPSSFILCGLGAVGLLVAARRRRNA